MMYPPGPNCSNGSSNTCVHGCNVTGSTAHSSNRLIGSRFFKRSTNRPFRTLFMSVNDVLSKVWNASMGSNMRMTSDGWRHASKSTWNTALGHSLSSFRAPSLLTRYACVPAGLRGW